MIRTRASVVALGLLGAVLAVLAAGCAVGYTSGSVGFAIAPVARPHPSYFCADCHGVLYFDPYYDLCLRNGYYFDWRRHPDVVASYRRNYVRIRETYPQAGRYRYPKRYREEVRERFADDDGRLPSYRNGATKTSPAGKGPARGPKKTRAKSDRRGAPREQDEGNRGNTGRSSGSQVRMSGD